MKTKNPYAVRVRESNLLGLVTHEVPHLNGTPRLSLLLVRFRNGRKRWFMRHEVAREAVQR